jgi:hypothetical protein
VPTTDLDKLLALRRLSRTAIHCFAWKQGKRKGRYWLPEGKTDVPANRLYGARAEKAASAQTGKAANTSAPWGQKEAQATYERAKKNGVTGPLLERLKARAEGAAAVKPERAEGFLQKLEALPGKAVGAVKDAVGAVYHKIEDRYGKNGARAVAGAAAIGTAIPFPGASVLAAAPVVAALEIAHQIRGEKPEAKKPAAVKAEQNPLLRAGAKGPPSGTTRPAPKVPAGAPKPTARRATLADGRAVSFLPHRGAKSPGYTTLMVDPQKLDAAWQKDEGFHVPPGGGGAEIRGRRAAFERFLATGAPVEAPKVNLAGEAVAFDDGRHRFSVLRDAGIDRVAVTVPASQAAEFRKRFAPASGATPDLERLKRSVDAGVESNKANKWSYDFTRARAALSDAGKQIDTFAKSKPAEAVKLAKEVTGHTAADAGDAAELLKAWVGETVSLLNREPSRLDKRTGRERMSEGASELRAAWFAEVAPRMGGMRRLVAALAA